MKVKTVNNALKAVAIVQAVTAPALIVVGHLTGNKIIRNIGIGWCAFIALDTARTTCDAIDNVNELHGFKDDDELN